MNYISSVQNEHVKHIVNLHDKSYRYEHNQFFVEGTRACAQLLEKYTPITLYMTDAYYKNHTFQQYEDIIVGVTDHVMNKICASKNPSGICAIFAIPHQQPLPHTGPGLILMNVNDPGNLGTLIRTAAAMNIKEVIIVEGVDPYNPKVIQSAAGCLTNINLYQTTLKKLVCQKLSLCALVVKDGMHPEQINLTHKFLVVGNEAHGLSDEQIDACQEKMTIPMPGHTESLNAAIAGAIAMYIMTTQTITPIKTKN